MESSLLDMEQKLEKITGLLRTLGEPNGERMDTSDFSKKTLPDQECADFNNRLHTQLFDKRPFDSKYFNHLITN